MILRIAATAALLMAAGLASEPGSRTARRGTSSNQAALPIISLVVNDLKHGDRPGRIALRAHVETDAYFGPIAVTAR